MLCIVYRLNHNWNRFCLSLSSLFVFNVAHLFSPSLARLSPSFLILRCVRFDYLSDLILAMFVKRSSSNANFSCGSLKLFHYTISITINLELACVFLCKHGLKHVKRLMMKSFRKHMTSWRTNYWSMLTLEHVLACSVQN